MSNMNKRIYLEVSNELNRFIKKCIDNNINLYNISYKKDKIIVLIDVKDYLKIKRLNYYSKIRVVKYDGLLNIKKIIKDNMFYISVIFLSFIWMNLLTNYIVDIEIIHSNSGIRRLLKEELDKNNVKKFSLAYSFEELDNITKKILADNKNNLEWVSIKKDGMKYIVRAEERIIKSEVVSDKPRDIVASKDAYITKVIGSKGNVLVRQGEYVKKGTVLISGKITLYEDVKGVTSASGSVYGNVWYECTVETPKEISSERLTGRKRYNLNVGNKILLRNKYQNFRQKNIREIKIFGLKIKFYREEEVEIIKTKTDDEYALNRLKEEFDKKLNGKGVIIYQKVLKKDENNSTIKYRVFIITNELINAYSYFEDSDINDTNQSN
ncbi:putative stage IV sporulation YqfD [Clostridium sp. CAG:533]|nr:putative stage IV sporulation YqfD [Clostridium sp. CAG:533]